MKRRSLITTTVSPSQDEKRRSWISEFNLVMTETRRKPWPSIPAYALLFYSMGVVYHHIKVSDWKGRNNTDTTGISLIHISYSASYRGRLNCLDRDEYKPAWQVWRARTKGKPFPSPRFFYRYLNALTINTKISKLDIVSQRSYARLHPIRHASRP